jgi:hypothetical protein
MGYITFYSSTADIRIVCIVVLACYINMSICRPEQYVTTSSELERIEYKFAPLFK